MNRTRLFSAGALALAATLVIAGCVSRYRVDLYMLRGEERKKVDVEETAYAADSRLNDPIADPKVIPGTSSTIMISIGTRGGTSGGKDLVLGFDEYLKYRIYVELPARPAPGSIDLVGHSFVQLLMRYELPPAQKIFLPQSGSFVVDSLKGSDLYATLNKGVWKNSVDTTVAFEGELKIKIK